MKKRFIFGIVSLIIFIIITVLVLTNNTITFDDYIYKIISNFRCDFLDIFFTIITKLGNAMPIIYITILLMIFLNKNDRILLGTSILETIFLNQILKGIISRERPPLEERLIHQGGYSYPSGHSMISLCLYGVLIYFAITKIKNKKLKAFLTIVLTTLIILVGTSRIYLRVHYPSDVLGGFLLTITILITNITLLNNHFRGNINDKNVS